MKINLFRKWNRELIEKNKVYEAIVSLEVQSKPSDDPELRYWQGYAAAQLDITDKVKAL